MSQSGDNINAIEALDEKVALQDEPKCVVQLTVPFPSDQLALVARNAIDADEVPNPELITRDIKVDHKNLNVTIECEDLFKLRTSLNNYIESVLQVKKTIQRFNYNQYGIH